MSEQHAETRSDHELIDAANRGEREAFAALYERHRGWVYAVALRYAGGDHAVAADVLQETFIRFLKRFPGFALTAQLRTYLYPFVRHGAIAAKQKRGGSGAAVEHVPQDTRQPLDQSPLAKAIEKLPAGQREVLLLRFADELSLAEIAAALGVPIGTVKSRLHHALSALRANELLKNLFFD